MLQINDDVILNSSRPQISVVVPVFNQEDKIVQSIMRIKEVLNSMMQTYELIIVNDGSRDNTLLVIKNEEILDPHIKVVSYERNKGKGYAVKKGVLESYGNTVMFIDGDLEIDSKLIKKYTEELKEFDLAIASKAHPLSIVIVPTTRKILSKAFNFIVRIGTGIKLKDTQSGLKAGKGDAMRMIFEAISIKRYAFDVELLAIATMLKMRIKEMPVNITLEKRFKIREILRMFKDILGISYRYRIKHSYQKRFESIIKNV
jgi:glycosyltransferase involved in cell wall biosynthesis